MGISRPPRNRCTTGRSNGAPSAPVRTWRGLAANTQTSGSACTCSRHATWCLIQTCRIIPGWNTPAWTPPTYRPACARCAGWVIPTPMPTSRGRRRRWKARPSWTPWWRTCKASASATNRPPRSRRQPATVTSHEPARLGQPDWRGHRHQHGGLHRHLDLGLAKAPPQGLQALVGDSHGRSPRRAGATHPGQGNERPGPGGQVMSWGWSLWVMGLVTLNMGITFLLFLWAPRAKIPTLPDQTSGHVWAHGVLREGVRRLPAWWVWFSASMFVAAWIYLMLYPGYGHHAGL